MRAFTLSTALVAAALAPAARITAAPPAAPQAAAVGTEPSTTVADGPEDLPVRSGAARGRATTAEGAAERTGGEPRPSQKTPQAAASGKTDEPPPAATPTPCGKEGCTRCQPQVPTCKPKWEDKKTKKATFSMKCDYECVRPWEPYHQGDCCEEKTTPCGDVHVKKKLFKTEEDRVERVLKYEVVMKPAAPCRADEPDCGCFGCRCLGAAFHRLFSWCR